MEGSLYWKTRQTMCSLVTLLTVTLGSSAAQSVHEHHKLLAHDYLCHARTLSAALLILRRSFQIIQPSVKWHLRPKDDLQGPQQQKQLMQKKAERTTQGRLIRPRSQKCSLILDLPSVAQKRSSTGATLNYIRSQLWRWVRWPIVFFPYAPSNSFKKKWGRSLV